MSDRGRRVQADRYANVIRLSSSVINTNSYMTCSRMLE